MSRRRLKHGQSLFSLRKTAAPAQCIRGFRARRIVAGPNFDFILSEMRHADNPWLGNDATISVVTRVGHVCPPS